MEEKLKIAEQKRKTTLLIYFMLLAMSLSFFIMMFTGILPPRAADDTEILYEAELVAVASLALIPFGIVLFNKMIKKANRENIAEWCNSYYSYILIRTGCCVMPIFTGSALYFISEKETYLYYTVFGLIATIYVYPSKRELIKLLNGETEK
ncbi:MAG: hypothetical protein J6J37_00170 [Bacteroidaceae bacterium]|nr:hypothetical protein [Bacteroidaceae bacterium]